MRILVYGAGVLGCYLAHVLHRGNNDVTLLASGSWKAVLDSQGLIILHYAQMKTTYDQIRTIDTLAVDDIYDIIFVVMQCTHLQPVLPVLRENSSKLIVFVGNNIHPQAITETVSPDGSKQILFGFQTSGGRREDGKLVCIRLGGQMSVGGLKAEDCVAFPIIRQAFVGCKYKLSFYGNMDAWLSSHLADILPIAYAVYACEGHLTRIKRGMLAEVISAISEGYAALEALDIPILPEGSVKLIRNRRLLCSLALWIVCKTPIGRLAASDHAMAAMAEMAALHQAFTELKDRAGIKTPCWDNLAIYMPKV